MKKLMALFLSVTMLLSLMTGLTITAGAAETGVTPTVVLTDNTEGKILNWVVTNNTNANYYQAWYDNTNHHFTFEGFDNVATIQTKRYEPVNDPWKTLYLTDKNATWATMTVNHSCEVYILGGEASSSSGKWILDQKFDLVGTTTSDFPNSPPTLNIYKKTFMMADNETMDIPLGATNPDWNNQMYSFIIKWIDNLETPLPKATLNDSNNLGWVLTNDVVGTTSVPLYHNSQATIPGDAAYDSIATIQTGRYETASGGVNHEFFKGNTTGYAATVNVNHSCDLYVVFTVEAVNECGKWLLNDQYEYVGVVQTSDATPQNRYLYKKTVKIADNETAEIQIGGVNSNWSNQQCSYFVDWIENLETPLPKASITNNNNLGWILKNGIDVSSGYAPWHDNSSVITAGVSDFTNVSVIQTGRYECANGGANYDFWKGKATDHVETITVNHSCDIYVFFSLAEVVNSCGKWILNDGYKYLGTTNLSNAANPTFGIYKKTIKLADNETAEIPVGGVNSNYWNQMCGFLIDWTDNRIDATLTLANTNALNWEVVNNTTIEGNGTAKAFMTENKYYTDIASYDFSDVSYIRSYSQYEPATQYYKPIYSKKTYHTIETMTVDNSCEIYIVSPWGTHQDYFQWVDNYGYQLQNDKITIATTEYNVFKKAVYLKDGETCDIPLGAPNSNMVNQGYNVIVKWIPNPEVSPARVSFTTLGDHAEYYTVTENAYAGERIVINASRKIADFNNSGLEGAYVLKGFYGDINDTDYGYLTSPEDKTLIQDKDFYTLTLDKTATVYIASNGEYIPGTYMRWLADWQLAKDSEGNVKSITVTNDDGTYNKNWVLYKKTFIVPEGETRTVTLGNAVLYANEMYTAFIKFTDADAYTVNLTVNGEGANIHPKESTDVLSGETLPFVFGMEEGYYIKSVKFNGNEIYSNSDEAISWITPEITSNATVEVTYESVETYPMPDSIPSNEIAFSAKGTEDLIVDYKVYPLNVIGFATAKAKIGGRARGEFGMLVTFEKPADVSVLTVDNADTIRAIADDTNSKGQYGIRLYGDSITSGQKCWMRAYAFYGDTVLYGTELIEAEF